MKYARFKYQRGVPKLALGGNTLNNGDQLYNSGKQAVGAVPIWGTAINAGMNIGDAIGKPIRQNAEKLDDQGNIINQDKATAAYTAGVFFNPYKALTRTLTDKNSSTGQKAASLLTGGLSAAFDQKGQKSYFDNIEGNAKAKMAEEQAAIDAQAAEEAQAKAEYDKAQQDNINNNYLNNHSVNGDNGTIYAKYGARLPKYPDGGKVKTSDPNDPRIKAYNDSLTLYNSSKEIEDFVNSLPKNKRGEIDGDRFSNFSKDSVKNKEKVQNHSKAYDYLTKINGTPPYENFTPINAYSKNFNTSYKTGYTNWLKPKTEVVYEGKTAKEGNTEIKATPYYNVKYTKDNTGKVINEEYFDFNNNPIQKMGDGGNLNYIASDTQKAVGNTHEDGGIKLKNNGVPYAEVEDQEIIKEDKVYSDRLELPNGSTIAEEAEKLGKIKGKNEEKSKSYDYRQSNSASRTIDIADQKLEELFNYQEAMKPVKSTYPKYGPGGNLPSFNYNANLDDEALSTGFSNFLGTKEAIPEDKRLSNDYLDLISKGKPTRSYNDSYRSTPNNDAYNMSLYSQQDREALLNPSGNDPQSSGRSFNWQNAAQSAIPFIDNAYNAYQISKTPEVPEFTKKQYYAEKALPMKTNYDINSALSRGNDSYRAMVNDLNNTTNNNQVARANKLGAYSTLLKSNNDLYQNKANVETQLANMNNQNIQNVYNQNIRNKQGIDNLNLSQEDQRRFAKVQRGYDILNAKMSNVANATEDATMLAKDYNMRNLDRERMNLDNARYTTEEQAAIRRRKSKNNIK